MKTTSGSMMDDARCARRKETKKSGTPRKTEWVHTDTTVARARGGGAPASAACSRGGASRYGQA